MDFFTSIDQHLTVLRGLLGDVTTDAVTAVTARLADDAVVTVITETTAIVKAAEAVRAVAAGVTAARSTRDAGHNGLAQTRGHRSPVSLVQEITGTSRTDAARQVRLGESLLGAGMPGTVPGGPDTGDGTTDETTSGTDGGDPDADTRPDRDGPVPWDAPLGAALLDGTITTTQHDAIRRGLGDPPTAPAEEAAPGDTAPITGGGAVDPAVVQAWRVAAEQLVAEAGCRTVEEVGQAARRIRDLLDPDGAHHRYLARYEGRAFHTWTDVDGIHHGRFTFDDHGYAWVRTVIDTALRPRTGGPRFVDPDEATHAAELVADPRTNDQLCYDLILDLLHTGTLADTATVFGVKQPGVRVVRIIPAGTHPANEHTAGGYLEETGDPVPAAFLTQHTCDTGTQECTLDETGNPLNLGRNVRLYTPTQRVALATRDGGCRIPGCDRPPHYCEAHHIDHWAHGGKTDVDRGILLCRYHHMALHHHGWHITRTGTRDEFTLHRPGHLPLVLKPRLPLTWAWTDTHPPPQRFRTAA